MKDDELVTEEVTKNVEEQATEELVEGVKDTNTEEEINRRVDELLAKKIARKEAKIRKEYETKYGKLTNVLSAGLETENIDEMTNKMSEYYKENGINIPEKPKYSQNEEEILAKAEANSIIEAGFDEVIEETDKLNRKGITNMSLREKVMFETLATYRKEQEDMQEFSKIGAQDVLKDKEFLEFKKLFDSKAPAQKVYELYEKQKTNIEIETLGSMNTPFKEESDFISEEAYDKLTEADLDKPGMMEKIRRSMEKW